VFSFLPKRKGGMESDPNSNHQQQHRILLPSDTDSATATEAAAKADHGEQDADLDLDPVVIEGEEVKVEKKRSSRKVRFNDCSLTQVLEFQPRYPLTLPPFTLNLIS
jgi:hypothetical protein